jgi:hypothetical protein
VKQVKLANQIAHALLLTGIEGNSRMILHALVKSQEVCIVGHKHPGFALRERELRRVIGFEYPDSREVDTSIPRCLRPIAGSTCSSRWNFIPWRLLHSCRFRCEMRSRRFMPMTHLLKRTICRGPGLRAIHLERFPQRVLKIVEKFFSRAALRIHAGNLFDPANPPFVVLLHDC